MLRERIENFAHHYLSENVICPLVKKLDLFDNACRSSILDRNNRRSWLISTNLVNTVRVLCDVSTCGIADVTNNIISGLILQRRRDSTKLLRPREVELNTGFLGDHSRRSDKIRVLERHIHLDVCTLRCCQRREQGERST